MTTVSDLAFPVLTFHKGGILEAAADEEILTTSTARDLKIGWFTNSKLIDSNGRTFKVVQAEKAGHIGRFWGWTWTLQRVVRVNLVLSEDPKPMSFEQVKDKVLKQMRREGESIIGEEEWREKMREIAAVQSIGELIRHVLPLFDRQRMLWVLTHWGRRD